VRLAYQFALENDNVSADAIEATEFPDLTTKYRVHAVPKTVVNQGFSIEGSLPEEHYLDEILKAVGGELNTPG
jgi:hypothetical protein